MTFKEQFTEKYKAAVKAFRSNDVNATLNALAIVYNLFDKQYSLNNDDNLYTKTQLLNWRDKFGDLIRTISKKGLSDSSVQKFFGNSFVETPIIKASEASNPELNNSVKDETPTPKKSSDGGINIAGIFDSNTISSDDDKKKQKVQDIPSNNENKNSTIDDANDNKDSLPSDVNSSNSNDESQNEIENNSPSKPTFDPDTLEGFIGQQHIVKILLKEIAIAKAQGRKHLDNILLLGNPGLGKTTLMRLLAKALDVDFEWMDCSQFGTNLQAKSALQRFFERISFENKPVVIALDEVHMLSTEIQSSLLTLLQSRVYITPPDKSGRIKKYPIEEFTFVAATTDDDKLLNTIKDRCLRLKFQMKDYTYDELKRIYQNKVKALNLTITDEAIDSSIPRSRGSIRYVDAFVKGFENTLYDEFGVKTSSNITLDVVTKFFNERGIDEMGLDSTDNEVLLVLKESGDTPLGAQTLAARVGLDVKKYSSEYEPYLIKIGFISVTPRGRVLTEKALEYLNRK